MFDLIRVMVGCCEPTIIKHPSVLVCWCWSAPCKQSLTALRNNKRENSSNFTLRGRNHKRASVTISLSITSMGVVCQVDA